MKRFHALRTAACGLCAALIGSQVGTPSHAQQPNPAELQQMMEQAQALQGCLANADQGALNELRSRGEAIAAELQAMCAAGQRDAAQARAVQYGREMADSPLLKSLGECGEMAQSMLQIPYVAETMEGKTQHVCDSGL